MQSCELIIQRLAVPPRPVEPPPAEAAGLLWWRSMLIAVASLCQSVSMLSAFALHSITHSLIHSIQLLTPSCTAATRQSISPAFLLKTPTLPPFGRSSLSPGETDVPSEKRPLWTISDTVPVSLIYTSSLEEKRGFSFFLFLFFFENRRDKGWRLTYLWSAWLGSVSDWITATRSLLLRHSYFTSAADSQWNSACGRDEAGLESPGEGNYPLWSLGNDMSLCDSFCYSDRREEVQRREKMIKRVSVLLVSLEEEVWWHPGGF